MLGQSEMDFPGRGGAAFFASGPVGLTACLETTQAWQCTRLAGSPEFVGVEALENPRRAPDRGVFEALIS